MAEYLQLASRSRVETIREGLNDNPEHRPIWIRAAEARLEELEFREALFALEPYEQEEQRALEELIGGNERRSAASA